MRVLVISYLPEDKFSNRLHLGFLRGLEEFCDYTYLFGGLVMRNGMTARDIEKEHNPDVVIHYDPFAPRGRQEMFSDTFFSGFSCAKVVIEVDFWKRIAKGGFEWYKSNLFDLAIRRGCFQGKEILNGTQSLWLPFSSSPEFYPPVGFFPSFGPRKNVVGFAGAYKSSGTLPGGVVCYGQRREAMKRLKEAGLLDHLKSARTRKGSAIYPEYLRSVVSALTSTEARSPHGKVFEIMASGTVLLTPDFDHKHKLFGEKECFVEFKDDCSDIVEKAKKILNEPEWAEKIAKRGYDVVQKYHTHKCRIRELYWHLCRLVAGRPVIPIWG